MNNRYCGLDLLKFMANIGIIFHHYQQVTCYSFNYYFDFYHGFFYWGYLVELFFCISGFFATRYIERIRGGISFGDYIDHKLKRFVPPIFVCTIVSTIILFVYHRIVPNELLTPWGNFCAPSDLWKIITSIFCMNFGGVVNPQNGFVGGVTWTVCVLIICEIILYVIVRFSDRFGIKNYTLYVGMILLGIAIQEYSINLPFLNSYVARGYCGFFAGLLLGLYLKRYRRCIVKLWIRIGIFAVMTVLTIVSSGQEYLLSIIIFPLMISIFTDDKVERIFAGCRGWNFLGNIGFEVYIWHPVVMAAWLIITYVHGIEYNNYGFAQMIIFTMMCVAIGIIAYYFIEKPISKLMKNRIWLVLK